MEIDYARYNVKVYSGNLTTHAIIHMRVLLRMLECMRKAAYACYNAYACVEHVIMYMQIYCACCNVYANSVMQ